MLVMRFLTNKQVFKTPSWYLTQTFGEKTFKKCRKRGKKIFFSIFFILLKTNTNYAHMQSFIQIPQKMKTGVQNVFKWDNSTLPFEGEGFINIYATWIHTPQHGENLDQSI